MTTHTCPSDATSPARRWQEPFLEMLPQIERHLRIAFRSLGGEAREEAVQEGLVNALTAYRRLHQRGKAELAYPSVLARYAELEIWRQAAETDYQSHPALADDGDFDGYSGWQTRWSQEVDQIGRMADDVGDGRFYYTGMAQAVLLDRLLPGWKEMIFENGMFLEDLLATAVPPTP